MGGGRYQFALQNLPLVAVYVSEKVHHLFVKQLFVVQACSLSTYVVEAQIPLLFVAAANRS